MVVVAASPAGIDVCSCCSLAVEVVQDTAILRRRPEVDCSISVALVLAVNAVFAALGLGDRLDMVEVECLTQGRAGSRRAERGSLATDSVVVVAAAVVGTVEVLAVVSVALLRRDCNSPLPPCRRCSRLRCCR